MLAALSAKARSASNVPLLVTACVAAPMRSAMSMSVAACTVPLLVSVPFTRSVAAPAPASMAPALVKPLAAFRATVWPLSEAVAALPSALPLVSVSALPACTAPLASLVRSPVVVASILPAASTLPLLRRLAAATPRSPALCSVPLLAAAPDTATWSFAPAFCESSHVPALSSEPSVAVLPVAACVQPVAVLLSDAAFSASACSASSLPLLTTACVAPPVRSAMSMLPFACSWPLLVSVPSTRSVALPLSAVAMPALARPLPAVTFSDAAFSTPVPVLDTAPPLVRPSVPLACAVPLLVRSPVVVAVRSVAASRVPLLFTLPAPTATAPAPCSVPLLASAPVTLSLSLAPAACDSSHAPALSMPAASTVLPACAWMRPVAVLLTAAAFSASACSVHSVPLFVRLAVAPPLLSAMSRFCAAWIWPVLAMAPSARTVTAPLSAVIVPAFETPLPAVNARLPPSDCSAPPVAVPILPLEVSAMLPADCSAARPSARSPLSALAISVPPLL
jgi:hypothetical protein